MKLHQTNNSFPMYIKHLFNHFTVTPIFGIWQNRVCSVSLLCSYFIATKEIRIYISSLLYMGCYKLELPLKLTETVRKYLCTEYELFWTPPFLVYHRSISLDFSCKQLQLRASSCSLGMDLLQKLQEPRLPHMIVVQRNSFEMHRMTYGHGSCPHESFHKSPLAVHN